MHIVVYSSKSLRLSSFAKLVLRQKPLVALPQSTPRKELKSKIHCAPTTRANSDGVGNDRVDIASGDIASGDFRVPVLMLITRKRLST